MLRRAIVWLALLSCLWPTLTFAMEKADLEKELKVLERGEKLELRIPGAKFRVAVFTYEDPDKTQLGDAIATLVGRQLLVQSAVSSFGVLTYEGGLAPSSSSPLSYFDKVDKISSAQEVTLSLWGMVRRRGSTLVIDSYVQLPSELAGKTFVWRVQLPSRMKGELVAHLQPERILAQHLELPDNAIKAIGEAGQRSGELRAKPTDDSPVVSMIPRDKVYWIEKSQDDWIQLNAGGGKSGWVRASGGCAENCAELLKAASFGAALLAFMEKRTMDLFPESLSPDTDSVRDQLMAYELIDHGKSRDLRATVERIGDQLHAAQDSGRVPAGGAGLANAWMIDSLMLQLQSEANLRGRNASGAELLSIYRELEPDRAEIGELAFRLAEASLNDPGNTDVLHNLSVLFEYAGDAKRASLARSLAEKVVR